MDKQIAQAFRKMAKRARYRLKRDIREIDMRGGLPKGLRLDPVIAWDRYFEISGHG